MDRVGIYVNGNEIVRRYVGDKLVWRSVIVKKIATIESDKKWGKRTGNAYEAELTEYFGSFAKDASLPIAKISCDGRVWKANKTSVYFTKLSNSFYKRTTVFSFETQLELDDFINFMENKQRFQIDIYAFHFRDE